MALPPVRTKVGANVSPFVGGISSASESLTSFSGGLKGAALALGVFAGAKGLGGALDAAVKFERQVAELEKLLGPEFARPAAEAVSDLGNRLAASRDQLFGAAEAAARLGVRGTRNIEAFTETMGKVGLVTDLSAEQASTSMARLAKVSRTPIPAISNLASTVNEASNTMAVGFSEVLDSSLRAAPGLATLGAEAPEIVALSASVAELSANASRSGTRLNRLASVLQDVDTEPAFARALGVTVDEFRTLRRESPADVIVRLAEVMAQGGDRARALSSELDETSLKVLRTLAQNVDDARGRIDQMSRAFDDNISLQKEYNRFADTAAARTQVLENRMEDLRVEIGEQLLPAFVNTLEKANFLIGALNRLGGLAGDEPVTGMEAVSKALDQVVSSSSLTTDEVQSTEAAIREAASRFENADQRAAFLELAFDRIRNSIIRTPKDLDELDRSLGSLFLTLQRTEDRARRTAEGVEAVGDAASGAAGDGGAGASTEEAIRRARLRLLEDELGLVSLKLERETMILETMIQQGAAQDEIARQAERVAKLQRRLRQPPEIQPPRTGGGTPRTVPPEAGLNLTPVDTTGVRRTFDLLSDPSPFADMARVLEQAAIPAIDEFAGELGLGTGALANFLDAFLTGIASEFRGSGGIGGTLASFAGAFAGGFQRGGRIPPGRFGEVHPGEMIVTGPANVEPVDRRRGRGGAGDRVEINVTAEIRALDARGVDRVLREGGQRAIVDAVVEAARSSEGFSRSILSGSG